MEVIEHLLTPHSGLAIAEREVEQIEVGGSPPRHLRYIVLGVVRDGYLMHIVAAVPGICDLTLLCGGRGCWCLWQELLVGFIGGR